MRLIQQTAHAANVLLLLLAPACNRYELRRITCPEPEVSTARSVVAWDTTPGSTASISGLVVTVPSAVPLSWAQVRLGETGAWQSADSVARFGFHGIRPGTYLLEVRAVGYHAIREALRVPADTSLRVVVVLAPAIMSINEACGMMVRMRKPWWKVCGHAA